MKYIFAIFCLLMPSILQASWANISLSSRVREQPVVITGRVAHVEHFLEPGALYDTAYIEVGSVLKNRSGTPVSRKSLIPLRMPAWHKGKVIPCGAGIVYHEGDEGVWLLSLEGDRYDAGYPKDLQPMSKLKSIRDQLRRDKRKNPNH